MLRFIWNGNRGYWLTPWRNPFLKWRIETYWGLPAGDIDARTFWRFVWVHRAELWRFLRWAGRNASAAH